MNKRGNQSASPPLLDVEKKQHLPFDAMGNSKQKNTPPDSLTKDEEEVAEALYALASTVPTTSLLTDRLERTKLEDKSLPNVASTSYSEVPSKDGKNFSPACTTNGVTNLSTNLGESKVESKKVDPPIMDQPLITSQSPLKVEQRSTTATHCVNPGAPHLSRGEVRENLSSGNAMSFPSSLGVSVQCYSGNRSLQQTKSDIPLLPPPKTDGNHWLFGSAVSDMKVNKERLAKKSTEKEAAPSVQHRLSKTNHGHMAVPSSYIGAVFPDTSIGVARPSPTGNHDKLPISNFGHKKSWKNCATHVYIGHLIEVYQNKEKMQASSATPLDRSKPGVGSKPRDGLQNGFNFVSPPKPRDGLQNGFNFVSPPAKNITFVDRNVHEVKMHASHNGRLLPIHHQRPDIHETHSQPRMGYDLLSLSAGHEAHISGNGMRTSGQLHAPFLQPHVPPQHSAMPFPFSHIPYTQPYPENLVSPANQQIQLQLPHYVGNPFYVSYGNIPGSSPKLQQQQQQQQQRQQKHFSPVHMAQYRPPWSNGKLHDSSSLAPIQLRLHP
ncbi:hypothetical protein ACMD2_17668 [Ananas comosus]|uniref:Uncharacterized protein n=1 Tax=Ananas comosus TaxID=4615 RepID=A0A199W4A7_ANACO|nr:hypothetical protein ACMD2_17668 [Ananas comosus]